MPPGQDPDEVIRRSPAEWSRLVDNARPLLEFVISAMTVSIDPNRPEGKDGVIRTVYPLIVAEQDGPRQDYYLQMLAQKLNVTRDFLVANYGRPTVAQRPRQGKHGSSRNGSRQSRQWQRRPSPSWSTTRWRSIA